MSNAYHPLKAALWMSGAIASFTGMAIAARAINGVHDSFEIMAARSVIGLGIVLVAAIAWIFHGQKLDFWAFIGMGLIVSGVAVLNLLSKVSAH